MEQNQGGAKSPLYSKTLHFNTTSGILVAAAWPFLPKEWREDPMTVQAIIAWLTIGNILLRFVTKTAIAWRTK